MVGDTQQSKAHIGRALIATQLVVAVIALALILFAPRAGEPVTLFPLSSSAAATLPAILSHPDTRLLARGKLNGSFVIRGHRPGFLQSLAENGVLILSASAPGCGSAKAEEAP